MILLLSHKLITFLVVLAAAHAQLELQIEGLKGGWALRLPCWRIDNWITRFILGKDLTGYHFWLLVVFAMLFHGPFLFIEWTLKGEYICLGLYIYYWIAEDYFWFAQNKLYGLRNFKPRRIFWHRRWIGFLPVSYWTALILGGICLWLGR